MLCGPQNGCLRPLTRDVCLREVKMKSFRKEIAGTAVWCPLNGGV